MNKHLSMKRYDITYVVGVLRDVGENDWERYRFQSGVVFSEDNDLEGIAREAERAGLRRHALTKVREEQGCSEGDIVTIHGVEILEVEK